MTSARSRRDTLLAVGAELALLAAAALDSLLEVTDADGV